MKAIILAGGQGTRLKPYTTLLPKALVPLVDMPVMELVLRQLKHYGVTDITVAVGHLAELIEAYFGDGRKIGVNITYAIEETPLGTAGPLRTIADLPENFLVMNADIISDINFRDLFAFHEAHQGTATIATYRRTSTSALDNETEASIKRSLDDLMVGRTTIVIAHRYSTIQKAEKIVVMDEGEIKEAGTHQELLEKKGLYYLLYNSQFLDNENDTLRHDDDAYSDDMYIPEDADDLDDMSLISAATL